MDKKQFSVAEVAATLNISPRTVRQWIADGKLAAKRHGKAWQINADSVEKHLPDDNSAMDWQESAGTCHMCEQKQSEIDYLRTELTEKNRQLESQAQQIDRFQQLLAMQSKTTAALTEQLETERRMIEDQRRRKPSWFKRTFRWT